eukprot:s3102_g5.t1
MIQAVLRTSAPAVPVGALWLEVLRRTWDATRCASKVTQPLSKRKSAGFTLEKGADRILRWLGGDKGRERWFRFKFTKDQLLECSVRDDAGHTQGTIVVKVLEKKQTGPIGHFVLCKYISASDSHYRWWATEGPGKGLSKKGMYHFCDGNSAECNEKYGRHALVHVEAFRLLTDSVLRNKPRSGTGDEDELPWVDQEKDGESESSSSSDQEEDEDMKQKIARLKRELADAEKKAKKGEKVKRRRTPTRGDGKREDKKDKRKKRASEGSGEGRKEHRKPKDKGEKKKRERSKRRERPGSARDAKRRGDRSVSPGRKRRRSSSSSHEKRQDKLFGGGGSGRGESDSDGDFKGDRGPFGAAEKERFGDKKDDDSSDESLFRDAPTQGAATSQLKLTEYALRYPGRLAARLLLRMHRESSLASVGATLGKKRTPAAALHYLQTMMLPALGQKANVRTSRELRTLCTVLDLMAQHKMPQAADIVAQRVKALERACQEGHWGAAQLLELIAGEQGLLDRSEQYYLSKEYIMEQKLKNLDKNAGRTRKGDQKGLKGRGGKGDREKGGGAGKGKDKTEAAAK